MTGKPIQIPCQHNSRFYYPTETCYRIKYLQRFRPQNDHEKFVFSERPHIYKLTAVTRSPTLSFEVFHDSFSILRHVHVNTGATVNKALENRSWKI